MEFLPIILGFPYVVGLVISGISMDGWSGNMSGGEICARILTWPIWLLIFMVKGFFEALKNEFS